MDKFVNFITAQLAKTGGYECECNYIYSDEGRLTKSYFGTANNNNPDCGMICTAPTQTELHRWLRKIRKLFVCITISHHGAYRYSIVKLDELNGNTEFEYSVKMYNEYEEALENGLQAALEVQ